MGLLPFNRTLHIMNATVPPLLKELAVSAFGIVKGVAVALNSTASKYGWSVYGATKLIQPSLPPPNSQTGNKLDTKA